MIEAEQDYNISGIRKLFVAAFTVEDLKRFCRDRPALESITTRSSPNASLQDMVDEVIDYCSTQDLFHELLTEVRHANSRQYARFYPYLGRLAPLPNRKLEEKLSHLQHVASTQRANIYSLRESATPDGRRGMPHWAQHELEEREAQLSRYEEEIRKLRQELTTILPRELEDILEFAKEVARIGANEAGNLYNQRREVEVLSEEGVKNLTTEADRLANKTIITQVRSRYPDHYIISEEGGDIEGRPNDKGFTWVIDAIDGTVNFFLKFPYFCTAIGILWNGEPCAGVIYDPIRRERFFARKGGAAYKEGLWREGAEPIELRTSSEEQLTDAVVLTHLSSRRYAREKFTSSGLLDSIANAVRGIRALGSGQLALAYVAQGKFHAFINNSTYSWDQTAGLVIVESAGGVVTDFEGQPWDIESGSIIAGANQPLHDKLAAIVSAIYPFEDPELERISAVLHSDPELKRKLLELLR